MTEKDYALAWDFVDNDGKPRQLRFRRNFAPAGDPRIFDGTGQLVAAIADASRADNFDEIPISRPNVNETDVDAAIDGWEHWALLGEADDGLLSKKWISLTSIQHRINAAGLGPEPPPNRT